MGFELGLDQFGGMGTKQHASTVTKSAECSFLLSPQVVRQSLIMPHPYPRPQHTVRPPGDPARFSGRCLAFCAAASGGGSSASASATGSSARRRRVCAQPQTHGRSTPVSHQHNHRTTNPTAPASRRSHQPERRPQQKPPISIEPAPVASPRNPSRSQAGAHRHREEQQRGSRSATELQQA